MTHSEHDEIWASRSERGTVVAMKIIVWIALHLGRTTTRLLLFPVCLYFLAFSQTSTKASRKYLRRVLNHEPSQIDCLRHYHTFAACVLDRVYLLNNQLDLFDIRIEGEEIANDEIIRGTGCFLFGAHLGSFEVLRAIGRKQTALKLSLLMYEDNARKINSVLNAINPEHTLDVIALGRSGSMLTVEERLNQSHYIGVLADRDFSVGNKEHLYLDFLGEKARFPLGPFRLAAVLRRPVILMIGIYRGGRRYDVHFERIADFSNMAHATRSEAIEQAIKHFVGRIEFFCRSSPYNWFNFYDFWQ